MLSKRKVPERVRDGRILEIGHESIYFGRHILSPKGPPFEVQHRLFANDPWELVGEAIYRVLPRGKVRDLAQSFRRQAEDYFRAATAARELGVRPVLLYYAFLNLSKAFAITRGRHSLAGRAGHGISCEVKPRSISGLKINLENSRRPNVFQELLSQVSGNPSCLPGAILLGHLLPQIVPGHRLWCEASARRERFLTLERFDLLHDVSRKTVWLNLYIDRGEVDSVGLSEAQALSLSGFDRNFEVAVGHAPRQWICFQQISSTTYDVDPSEALARIIDQVRNNLWETVKIVSPYRKHYIYCCPKIEEAARLPQLISVYLLMSVLGYVTRYFPGNFEFLLDSKYGPLIQTFVSESPAQFLYLMASEILRREVSKPAII